MADLMVQIEGNKYVSIQSDLLPPVGAKIVAHKHLYDGETYLTLEVLSHEWTITDAGGEDGTPAFEVHIKTRIVRE